MRFDRDEDEEGPPNLTPLIDMVFLLLVFFLASTTFAREEKDMSLELPQAQSGKAREASQRLVINVSREGTITVDGRAVTMEALRQKLAAAAARNKEQEVLIRGDKGVQFGLVAQALDACLAASLKRVGVATQPLSGAPGVPGAALPVLPSGGGGDGR